MSTITEFCNLRSDNPSILLSLSPSGNQATFSIHRLPLELTRHLTYADLASHRSFFHTSLARTRGTRSIIHVAQARSVLIIRRHDGSLPARVCAYNRLRYLSIKGAQGVTESINQRRISIGARVAAVRLPLISHGWRFREREPRDDQL